MLPTIEAGIELVGIHLEIGGKFFQIGDLKRVRIGEQDVVILPVLSLLASAA
jgi:hypothetical protein